MIKNLLNADEEPPPGTKVVVEETIVGPSAANLSAEAPTAQGDASKDRQAPRAAGEIPEKAKFVARSDENAAETAPLDENAEALAALMADIENLEAEDLDRLEREIENLPAAKSNSEPRVPEVEAPPSEAEQRPEITAAPPAEKFPENAPEPTIFQTDYTPPSTAETIRSSGLAWSAGVVLFGSVVFMMIFGWFADLILGSSPWGVVAGIVLGGLIGIIQLFRISSQIYRK